MRIGVMHICIVEGLGYCEIKRVRLISVIQHARDAFTKSSNKIYAELCCIVWTLQSLRDLLYTDVVIATECKAAFEAVMKPNAWPRYCGLLHHICMLRTCFNNCVFEEEQQGANSIVREIAKSVTREWTVPILFGAWRTLLF